MIKNNQQVRAYLESAVALWRVGEPDDIAAAVASLLSEANHWIIWQRIEISGGQSLWVGRTCARCNDLTGKTALITGSWRGLGKAIALREGRALNRMSDRCNFDSSTT
jgi:NAD(P)-dependent dehydrogenase (short-subunit alcohol dehydrogenase family)